MREVELHLCSDRLTYKAPVEVLRWVHASTLSKQFDDRTFVEMYCLMLSGVQSSMCVVVESVGEAVSSFQRVG